MSTLNFEEKSWEEKYFKCPVYNINLDIDDGNYEKRYRDTYSLILYWEDTIPKGKHYEYALVDARDIPVINGLEMLEFRQLVTTVELETHLAWFLPNPAIPIRSFEKDDIPELERISGESFIYGRLPAESHNIDSYAMHAEWIRNCCTGYLADNVLVSYSITGKPTGFIALKIEDNICDIVLIAVDSEARGIGIGTALLREGCNWAIKNKAEIMRLRTELPSIAALRLYEKNGFLITKGGVYLGRWVWK